MSTFDWSKAIGDPDEQDKRGIALLIKLYDKKFPGQIDEIVRLEKQAEIDNASAMGVDPFLVKNKDSEFRKVIVMPPSLADSIKENWPSIFRDKKHFSWFVKNFPRFRVADKY